MLDLQTIELLLNIPFLSVTKVEVLSNKIEIYCSSNMAESLCPTCLKKCQNYKQITIRKIRDLSLIGKEVYLHLSTRQFHCEPCNRYFQEQFTFVEPSKTMTIRYEKYVYECCRNSSISRVSIQEDIVWDSVQAIFKRYGKKETLFLNSHQPTRIGIDEFALKKGHQDFVTVLIDLDNGYVIDVLPYRTKEELIAYFQAKGSIFCQHIQVFSCDLWDGFISTAKAVFPNADIVADRFHFFKLLNSVLDKERKRLRHEFKDNSDFKAIKWLLFKHWEDLTHKQKWLLIRAFKKSKTLLHLYEIKNELRNIFEDKTSKQEAKKQIEEWIEYAKNLKHTLLDSFIKTFERYYDYVLNFFTHQISNGIVEGVNNVIKAIKRQGFGFRNFDNFKLKIQLQFL